MVRNLTTINTQLGTAQGTEPIIEVDLQIGSNTRRYSQRDIDGIQGRLLNISDLDDIINIVGSSNSTSITVTVSDTDDFFKNLFKKTDIHKQNAKVYQRYEGVGRSLLFAGKVNSPITWNEGDRTVSFDIVSKLEDREVGFSPEESKIYYLDPEMEGKAWPLVFGTAVNVVGVQQREVASGITSQDVGIHDPALPIEISRLDFQRDTALFWAAYYYLAAAFASFNNLEQQEQQFASKGDELTADAEEIEAKLFELHAVLDEQRSKERTTLNIIGGETFPQGVTIDILINDAVFRGRFSGQVFTIKAYWHPGVEVYDETYYKFPEWNINDPKRESYGFFYADAGTSVSVYSGQVIPYVVNILPSTVRNVTAYRTVEGARKLLSVPSDYYTIKTKNYGAYRFTAVALKKPLSSYPDEGWDDQVYATITSSVGPNVVDILEWLIDTYTDLSYDSTSFNSVKTKLTKYPANFALYGKVNIVQLLQDIAYQSRCALWIRDDVFYIKYLSEEPSVVATIGEEDVEANSLTLTFTSTEDLITVMKATYTDNGAKEKPNTYIGRFNVNKYGVIEQDIDYFIYHHRELVEKSVTFWLIRQANTWKKISFRTFITNLKIEPFDAVTLNLPDIAPNGTKAVVESMVYSPETKTIEMSCWLPIRSGENVKYQFAWPADAATNAKFPPQQDRVIAAAGGNSPGKDLGGFVFTQPPPQITVIIPPAQSYDWGDPTPSDSGDSTPSVYYNDDNINGGNYRGTPYEFSDEFINIDLEGDDIIIDLHNTPIFDFQNDRVTSLSSFFEISPNDKGQKLTCDITKATYKDNNGNYGLNALKWYNTKFLAEGAFLYDTSQDEL